MCMIVKFIIHIFCTFRALCACQDDGFKSFIVTLLQNIYKNKLFHNKFKYVFDISKSYILKKTKKIIWVTLNMLYRIIILIVQVILNELNDKILIE